MLLPILRNTLYMHVICKYGVFLFILWGKQVRQGHRNQHIRCDIMLSDQAGHGTSFIPIGVWV